MDHFPEGMSRDEMKVEVEVWRAGPAKPTCISEAQMMATHLPGPRESNIHMDQLGMVLVIARR